MIEALGNPGLVNHFQNAMVDTDRVQDLVDSRPADLAEWDKITPEQVQARFLTSETAVADEWEKSKDNPSGFYEESNMYVYRLACEEAGTARRLELLLRFVLPYVPKKGRVLDFGAGLGDVPLYLSQDYDTTYYDLRSPMSQFALFRDWKRRAGILFVYDWKWLPTNYDVITCQDVLEHPTDPTQTIAMLLDHVKPGGWFITSGLNFLPGVPGHLDDNTRYRHTWVEETQAMGVTYMGALTDPDGKWHTAYFQRAA